MFSTDKGLSFSQYTTIMFIQTHLTRNGKNGAIIFTAKEGRMSARRIAPVDSALQVLASDVSFVASALSSALVAFCKKKKRKQYIYIHQHYNILHT